MQVNLNLANTNKYNNEIMTGSYRADNVTEAGSFFDAKVSDEYTIKKSLGLSEEQVITRIKQEEKSPVLLNAKNLDILTQQIGAKDFSKFEELGITPEEDELGRVVTVSERIKIELATHCDNYKGDLSNISRSDLEAVYGRSGIAYSMLSELRNMDDNSKAYLLKNNMQPTIENVYKAEHSAVTWSGKALTDAQWEELKPQVVQIAENVGLEADDTLLENGRFLIENGIELTPQNIVSLSELDVDIEGRSMDEWNSILADGKAYGLSAENTSILPYAGNGAKVQEIMEAIENADEETIKNVMSSGREVTVLNLKKPPTLEEIKEKIADDRARMTREKLDEIREKMTFESCMTMMKNGIHVNIMTVQELSVAVDEYNQKNAEVFFTEPSKEKCDMLDEAMMYLEQMKSVPGVVLSKVASAEISFTMREIVVTGQSLNVKYSEAEKLYRAVGTEVRRDLGDNIKDALTNSYEDILGELNIEDTKESRRAIGILAYNEMEISNENMIKVMSLDEQVSKLFRNLTPATTAKIIEQRINPLDTDIEELNENLTKLNEETGFANNESYSRFLWKLDKNNDISKEDREAYIGVYKLIHRIEKDGRRAVGAVMKSGRQMNLKNLFTALESLEHAGKDVTVDDDLGLTMSVKTDQSNLANQLSHFESMYDGILDKIEKYVDADDILKYGKEGILDMPLEQLADSLEEQDIDMEYNEERAAEIESARYVSDETIEALINNELPVSVSNILAMDMLRSKGSGLFGRLKNDSLDKKLAELDMDNVDEEYEKALSEVADKSAEKLDIKSFRMLNRTVNLLGTMAKRQSYYVPLELDGETSTVKVSFLTGQGERGKIEINILSEEYGKSAIMFKVTGDEIKATLICQYSEAAEKYLKAIENMREEFGKISVNSIREKNISDNVFGGDNADYESVTNKRLYHIAKVFLKNAGK